MNDRIPMAEVRRRLAAGTRLTLLRWNTDALDVPDDVRDVLVDQFRGGGFTWVEMGGTGRTGSVGWPLDATFTRYGDEVTITTPERSGRRERPEATLLVVRVVAPPETLPAVFRLRVEPDPLSDRAGHRHDSDYVEACWLPRLGPTAWAVLRFIGDRLDDDLVDADGRRSLHTTQMAEAVGLSPKLDRRGQLYKALERLDKLRLLRRDGDELVVTAKVPPLPAGEVAQLPDWIQPLARVSSPSTYVARRATV